MEPTQTGNNYSENWKLIAYIGLMISALILAASLAVWSGNVDEARGGNGGDRKGGETCGRTTQTVNLDLACAVDEWSSWVDVSQDDPEGYACETYEVRQKRTGSGTRITSSTLTSMQGSCAGGTQVTSISQACQVEDFRTIRRTVEGITSNGTDCNAVPEVIIGDPLEDYIDGTTIIGSGTGLTATEWNTQITALRRRNIAANITANPLLVAPGTSSVITWTSREMTSCVVTGANNDRWSALASAATTSPITVPTTYTLTCVDFEGKPVAPESVTVSIAPKWNEQ